MTLAQVKELMSRDNLVNMDTRTVISGLDFTEFNAGNTTLAEMSDLGLSMMNLCY